MVPHSLKHIRTQFIQCFKDYGCAEEPAAKISSGIDPTVIFVGSTTNTVKKYILEGVPEAGLVIDQPSMRFRETKHLFDKHYSMTYGSFFNELGVLIPPTNSYGLCVQLHNYFTDYLGIPEDDLLVRAKSSDKDLFDIAHEVFTHIEADSMPDKYYQHVIGEDGYTGRNFNVAIRNQKTGSFDDVGNFLSFHRDGTEYCMEIGLGDTVIQRSLKGYHHVLDCYEMNVPPNLIRTEALNYINTAIVSSVLYSEGMVASNKNNADRLLLKHMRYLSLLKQEGKVTYANIACSIDSFERNYFEDSPETSKTLLDNLQNKEPTFRKTLIEQGLLLA